IRTSTTGNVSAARRSLLQGNEELGLRHPEPYGCTVARASPEGTGVSIDPSSRGSALRGVSLAGCGSGRINAIVAAWIGERLLALRPLQLARRGGNHFGDSRRFAAAPASPGCGFPCESGPSPARALAR